MKGILSKEGGEGSPALFSPLPPSFLSAAANQSGVPEPPPRPPAPGFPWRRVCCSGPGFRSPRGAEGSLAAARLLPSFLPSLLPPPGAPFRRSSSKHGEGDGGAPEVPAARVGGGRQGVVQRRRGPALRLPKAGGREPAPAPGGRADHAEDSGRRRQEDRAAAGGDPVLAGAAGGQAGAALRGDGGAGGLREAAGGGAGGPPGAPPHRPAVPPTPGAPRGHRPGPRRGREGASEGGGGAPGGHGSPPEDQGAGPRADQAEPLGQVQPGEGPGGQVHRPQHRPLLRHSQQQHSGHPLCPKCRQGGGELRQPRGVGGLFQRQRGEGRPAAEQLPGAAGPHRQHPRPDGQRRPEAERGGQRGPPQPGQGDQGGQEQAGDPPGQGDGRDQLPGKEHGGPEEGHRGQGGAGQGGPDPPGDPDAPAQRGALPGHGPLPPHARSAGDQPQHPEAAGDAGPGRGGAEGPEPEAALPGGGDPGEGQLPLHRRGALHADAGVHRHQQLLTAARTPHPSPYEKPPKRHTQTPPPHSPEDPLLPWVGCIFLEENKISEMPEAKIIS